MQLQPVSSLTLAPVDWLWPGYLAVGSLAMLDGDPGLGKSMLTLDWTARLTSGRAWPDGAPTGEPASVLLLCDEDADNVIVPRLQALGADLPRTYLWPRLDSAGLPRIPADITRLEKVLMETRARFIVIDPVVALLDSSVQIGSDASVRRALRSLSHMAERNRCVVLLVRHLNKRAQQQSLYRGGGSIAFVAACRSAWLVGRDPRQDDRMVLAQCKNNYASRQPSLAYALSKTGPGIEWLGPSLWNADELVCRRARPARRRAVEFLRSSLAAGPRIAREIKEAARTHRISKYALETARNEVGIRWERITRNGQRFDYWLLPGQEIPPGISDTPVADEALRKLGAMSNSWTAMSEATVDMV